MLFTVLICVVLILATSLNNAEYPGPIEGPTRLNETIAIIGGSFSAIHMAYLLKSRGFTEVEIFVEEDRLGGNEIYSKEHRGTVHEMGKHMLLLSSASGNIVNVMQSYGVPEPVEVPMPVVWEENVLVGGEIELSLNEYVMVKARLYYPGLNDSLIKQRMVQSIDDYLERTAELVEPSSNEIPPEPSWSQKYALMGSFKDFLERNNLRQLIPLFTCLFGVMGYGRVEDFSTYYGIFLFTPALLSDIKSKLLGDTAIKTYRISSSGLQSFLEAWVQMETLNVVMMARVDSIQRIGNGGYELEMDVNGNQVKRYCDFLVFTESMKKYVALNSFPTESEYQIFLRPTNKYLIKTLVDTENVLRGRSPVEFYTTPFNNGELTDYIVTYSVDSYAAHLGYWGDDYKNNQFNNTPLPNEANTMRSAVYTQLASTEPEIAVANNVLMTYLEGRGGSVVNIVETKIYDFFAQYTDRDITNGIIHEILTMQGKERVWYIGSSVYLDDPISMLGYNDMIMNLFSLN